MHATQSLEAITLTSGTHATCHSELSLLEAVAWMAGEPHTDQPKCVCPVLMAFGRRWNDGLPSSQDRHLLLRPLVPRLIGTRRTRPVEMQRAFLALDWLVRVQIPAWLQLTESLRSHAEILYGLPEIRDTPRMRAVMPQITAARYAARYVAGAASWAAAWAVAGQGERANPLDVARSTSWFVAGETAGEAVKAAAGTGARAAAGEMAREAAWEAWDAAREAAWAAAGQPAVAATTTLSEATDIAVKAVANAAARMTLQPTIVRLQHSALDLVDHMIDCR